MVGVITKRKKRIFFVLTCCFIICIPVVCYFGYFAYKKLTLSYNYCGSYGELDEELGWKLKENTSSCFSGTNYLTGETFFDSKIYTNNLGFRDIGTNRDVPAGAVTAIGDSWTFGYGVNYEETFPYLLSQKINFPVVNMGVPAYGSGSTLLLFERYVNQIRPSTVIYVTHGFWTRSLCFSEEKPTENLVPCFWWNDQSKHVELIKPQPGKVFEQAGKHVHPGGSLTAGYDNLEYFFIIKPLAIMNQIKSKVLAKLTSARKLSGVKRFDATGPVLEYTLRRYARLAKEYGFVFLMIDPANWYKPYLGNARKDFDASIIHIGTSEWEKDIAGPASKLPPQLRLVPKDGHYAIGFNQLIAKKIADALPNVRRQPNVDQLS